MTRTRGPWCRDWPASPPPEPSSPLTPPTSAYSGGTDSSPSRFPAPVHFTECFQRASSGLIITSAELSFLNLFTLVLSKLSPSSADSADSEQVVFGSRGAPGGAGGFPQGPPLLRSQRTWLQWPRSLPWLTYSQVLDSPFSHQLNIISADLRHLSLNNHLYILILLQYQSWAHAGLTSSCCVFSHPPLGFFNCTRFPSNEKAGMETPPSCLCSHT